MKKKMITSKSNIVVAAELVENDKYIVRNASLMKAVAEAGYRAEYHKVCMTPQHAVVQCTIKDAMGRVAAVSVGEVIPQYLRGDVATAYPYTLAFTRAFDRAALNALQFDARKVFSAKADITDTPIIGSIPCGLTGMSDLPVLIDDDEKYVIPHTSIVNVIADHPGRFVYSFDVFATGFEVNVVTCTIEDTVTGRCVSAVGETSKATLQTEIARTYPTTMAFNRAFDKAVINLLDIPVDRRVFSDSECLMGRKKETQRRNEQPASQPQQEATAQQSVAMEAPESDLFRQIEEFEGLAT